MPGPICRACGQTVTADAKFCQSCGKAGPINSVGGASSKGAFSPMQILATVLIITVAGVAWSIATNETDVERLRRQGRLQDQTSPPPEAAVALSQPAMPNDLPSPASRTSDSRRPACNRVAANNVLRMVSDPAMATVSQQDGWVVVQFGMDYASWSPAQTEGIITTYANADACINGKSRRLEFQSPSGRVIARVDELRGIQIK